MMEVPRLSLDNSEALEWIAKLDNIRFLKELHETTKKMI
jgi:hypothetical protein